jgi:hypothetical protein
MFSVITNIYNKKTKGPILMGFFTATEKLFFFTTRDVGCLHHGLHGTYRYDIPVLPQGLEYRIYMCRVTCDAHIEHL